MELKNAEILPGVVETADDPNRIGRVKATVPGWFDKESIPLDLMPWIMPFTMSGHQSFSMLQKGSKIWVLKNKDAYAEYWYIPMYEMQDSSQAFLNEKYEDSPEIISYRNNGGIVSSITYDDTDGYLIRIGSNSWNFRPNGDLITNNASGNIHSKGSVIHLGSDSEEYEAAVKGDSLFDVLDTLQNDLNALSEAASKNPKTANLTMPFRNASKNLQNGIQSIKAKNTKVN